MIVSIPEGLPLSVSLAIAFSVNKLKKQNILIKNIEAVEKMAMCHEVCISKTGCLTTGEMSVSRWQIADSKETIIQAGDNFKCNDDLKDTIFECIISNTDTRIEENDYNMMYEPCG